VCSTTGCSAGTNRVLDNATDVGFYPSIAIAPDGHPEISYLDHLRGLLKSYTCSTPSCSSGTARTIETVMGTGGATSIGIDSTGNAVISYADMINQDLKFARTRYEVTGIAYP